jgi:hypothetical protein
MKFEKTYFYEFNAKFKEIFDDLETAAKSEKPGKIKDLDITNVKFISANVKQVKEKEKNG